VQIIIKDTGQGIASEDLPFIFDRFWRGDKSRSGRTHSGLGLAITKQLILAHHGTIEAKSELGKGTTFIIELPDHLHVEPLVNYTPVVICVMSEPSFPVIPPSGH
jgi:signal transduction histidine kinase